MAIKIEAAKKARRMKSQLLIAMGMFLASCAGGQLLGHSEPKSDSSYNRDLYECERESVFARRRQQESGLRELHEG